MKTINRRTVLLTCIVLWTCFIWSQSLLSGAVSSANSGRVTAFLMRLFGWETQPVWLTFAVRKTAHFAEFAILGTLWGGYGQVRGRRQTALWGLPTGAVDECLQFLAPGRAPMVTDVLIDTAGYLSGVFIVWFFVRLQRKKIK